MKPPRPPLFLERETYRRRRLMDAARILPVLGFVLILLPVLWTQGGDGPAGPGQGGGQLSTAGEAVYLFVLWCALIGAAWLLSRVLLRAGPGPEGGGSIGGGAIGAGPIGGEAVRSERTDGDRTADDRTDGDRRGDGAPPRTDDPAAAPAQSTGGPAAP